MRGLLAMVAVGAMALGSACGPSYRIAYQELADEDPKVRADAARRLGDARAEDGVESLLAVLDDPDEEVRVTAIRSLGLIGDPQAIPEVVKLADDPLHTVRLQVTMSLAEFRDPAGVPALSKLLYDEDETTRVSAARALGRIGGEEALDALIQVALLDEAEMVRQHAVHEIGEYHLTKAIPRLESSLVAESDLVRAKSAEVLGMLGDVSCVPALLEALDDPYWKTRSLVAHSLGMLAAGDPEVHEALRSRLQTETHQMTRVDLAWNLARGGDRAHLDIVRTLLFRGDPEDVRAEAARALGDVGDESDLPRLEKAINDKRGLVRREAYEAYQKLKEA